MNKSRKARVEVPKLFKVRLVLRGSAVEPEPEPSAARVKPPTYAALVRSQRRVVRACEKVYRLAQKRVAMLQRLSEDFRKRSDAHRAMAECLAAMPRRRYAKQRHYVYEEGIKEVAAMQCWSREAVDRATEAQNVYLESQGLFTDWLCEKAKLETMIDMRPDMI